MLYALTDIKNFAEDDLVAFSPFLSLQRKQKIDRYKFFADKKISALAYLLLKSAYVIETGKRIMEDFEIGNTASPISRTNPLSNSTFPMPGKALSAEFPRKILELTLLE